MKAPHFRKKAARDHGDDWLMTYADMITLLLCLFAVMLSLSVPKKNAIIVPPNPPAEKHVFRESPPSRHVIIRGNLSEDVGEEEAVAKNITPLPQIITRMKSGRIDQDGARETTIEMGSAAFFSSGSSTVSKEGEAILKEVADNLKLDKFRDYQVTVEDYTNDAAPDMNWQLSAARAASVLHVFIDQDIPPQKLRAAGYADAFPPETQEENRRIVIRLERSAG